MTISNETATVTAQGNGATTSWTYTFLIPTTGSCQVSIYDASTSTSQTLSSSDFAVTGIGVTAGGHVTYPLSGSPLSSGQFLTIARVLPLTQERSIRNQGSFYPATVEAALDYLTMVTQQLNDAIVSIQADIGPVPPVLPSELVSVVNLAALRALTAGAGTLVAVQGHTTAGDGGAGWFLITTTNPGADNNGTLIHLNAAGLYAVRQMYEGYVTPQMFGAIADGATDCTASFHAAIDAVANLDPRGGGTIVVPRGVYYMASELVIDQQVNMTGETGNGDFYGSKLLFAAGFGMHVYYATEVAPRGGDWSIISNLFFKAAGQTSNVDGIYISGHGVTVQNCSIDGFKRNGIRIVAVAPASNANNWILKNCRITNNGSDGLFVDGPDVNAGYAESLDCSANGGWGIYDSSFLGNTYVACHTATNTSGSYKTDDANAANSFVGCYAESDQPPASMVYPTQVVGGAIGGTPTSFTTASSHSYIRSGQGNTRVNGLGTVLEYSAGVTVTNEFGHYNGSNGDWLTTAKSDVDSGSEFRIHWSGGFIVADWLNSGFRTLFKITPGSTCGFYFTRAMGQKRVDLTYGTTVSTDASSASFFVITVTTTAAFTINNPTNMLDGQRITYTIKNSAGAAMGTITWSSSFKLAAWTNPANGTQRSIDFLYDGSVWHEISRTPADVTN